MPTRSTHRTPRLLAIAGIGLLGAVFGAYAVLEIFTLTTPLRVIVAAVPLAAFILFIGAEVRVIRGGDELEQRIQLEALAVAYPVAVLLVYGLGLLERAGVVVAGFSSLRDVWPLTVVPYFIGFALARRRYR
jgi:hypothetical protein